MLVLLATLMLLVLDYWLTLPCPSCLFMEWFSKQEFTLLLTLTKVMEIELKIL